MNSHCCALFFLLFFFFFPVLSVVACIKLLISSEKAFNCTTEPANQQQCKFQCSFIFLSAFHSFHYNLSHTEFSLLSSFFLLCYFHSCYLYFLPSVVWVFAPISDPSSINFEFPVLLSRLLFFQPCKNPWLQWKCVAAESLLRSLICLLSLCWTSPSLLLDWS